MDNVNENRIHNGVVQPLLTDMYQITMAYGYWMSGKINDHAVFDLFFRKNPFQGEFTIFAGLAECMKFLKNFHYNDSDIEYLKRTLSNKINPEFFVFLRQLTAKDVTVYAIDEGSVVFPRVPLLRVEGPLIIVQLLETTLLNLVNYASLVATNAARYRLASGQHLRLLEFGLRRAQGPDGGLSASKYSYIGGFDGTSNVLAGKLFNIPVGGTQAHSYITSFSGFTELQTTELAHKTTGVTHNLLELSLTWRNKLIPIFQVVGTEVSDGELAALISFAIAFPDGFMALVDTYDVKRYHTSMLCDKHAINNNKQPPITLNSNTTSPTSVASSSSSNHKDTGEHEQYEQQHHRGVKQLKTTTNNVNRNNRNRSTSISSTCYKCINIRSEDHINRPTYLSSEPCWRSGLLNFCAVALALNELGYRALGIRIDSGDLAYLSNIARQHFQLIGEQFDCEWFSKLTIMASNDINEDTILSLNEQGHQIDCFGIGTHLVTCQRQPALGCVYKMVEINGQPRIKLSHDVDKVTMPGRKDAYRLYSASGHALIDLLQRSIEAPPEVGVRVLCRHPFEESKRAYVIPAKVQRLHKVYWANGQIQQPVSTLSEIRDRVTMSLKTLRTDIKRNLNPTPFKVAVSDCQYNFLHDLWLENAPIGELS
ncbi:nicotinate phosphoribosyltransferase isoform X1 [Chrysoperla carnea]|uniref:nicotinate phosphoribosyltransferase isoform X1 n=1 Tax=Chrysoperla carnea TaxID=189513 RepID=UPI001D099BA8|nr:nicotinate phosphoribosyltransferase isoform X1 [Chrysoperla carnea]